KHLGTHVRQQGSLVQPERLRFDFSHHGPIDQPLLDAIEAEVNDLVLANEAVITREMPYPDALSLGAMAFFSEKYGDTVRVVQMVEERQRLEARLADALKTSGGAGLVGETAEVDGVSLTIAETASDDRAEVGQIADRFREGKRKAVLVLFSTGGRGAIHVSV